MERRRFIQLAGLSGLGILVKPMEGLSFPPPAASSSHVSFYSAKDANYSVLRKGFNKRIDKKPAMIAVCNNATGVQEAVMLAKTLNLPIAVKSGGHCMEGFSGSQGGMQVILSNMKSITWLSPYRIKVGPGCLLKDVYENLIPKNKILPGGSCATVGIGGLTLGGGYGLMSRLFGLTCDSLEEVTMVDGQGTLVRSKNSPELLKACKGGGNGNFGIITDMIFKVHNRPSSMSSYRFRSYHISIEKAGLLLKTWMELSATLPNACFSTCLFNGDTSYILLTNVSKINDKVTRFINAMKKLNDKYTANVQQPLLKALSNYYGQTQPVLFKNASAGLYRNYSEIEKILPDVLAKVFSTKGMILQLNTLGGGIKTPSFEQSSVFPYREYNFFTELQTYWDKEGGEGNLLTVFEEVQHIIAQQGIVAQYRNYPDVNFKNPLVSYYGKYLDELKLMKKKYDPENRIRHEQSITI